MQTEYQAMIEPLMEPERSGTEGIGISYIPHIDGTREWLINAARATRDKNRLSRNDRYSMGTR